MDSPLQENTLESFYTTNSAFTVVLDHEMVKIDKLK